MKDTQGREWLFRFTARTVRELAAETHLDTKALEGENSLLQRVAKDESILYTVMWITIRPQAQSLGVTEDQWFDSLDNDALQAAAKEWVAAYINFSHPARQKVLSKTMEAALRKMDGATQAVETMLSNGEIDRVIDMAVNPNTTKATSPAQSQPSPDCTTTAAN